MNTIPGATPPTMLARPSSALYRVISLPPPPPPPKDDGYRPSTASTKRLSYSTTVSTSQRTIKYKASGKFAGEELSPQPSDDADDPLNWPQWKKELNFAALMLIVSLTSAMKTALVPVGSDLAARYQTSYSAVAALTAAPLIVSAFSGTAAVVAAKVVGKRPVYLASAAALFVGSMWAMRTLDSYAQAMAARVFQGLGWGAFDTLVLGSIYDTYFEHERGLRITIYNFVSTAITWGAPLLGGLAARNASRFTVQFEIINCFFALALPLLALGAPESTFDHTWSVSLQSPPSTAAHPGPRQPSLIPPGPVRITRDGIRAYLRTVPARGYTGTASAHTLLQAPRALAAPTTLLATAVTAIPHASLWALAGTLSLAFPALSAAATGSLMAGPFVLSVLVLSLSRLLAARLQPPLFDRATNLAALAAGTALFFAGALAFGLVAARDMARGVPVSYPLMSVLLGLVAAGASALDATVPPLVYGSAQYTSSNMYSCLRNAADMAAGATALRTLVAGVVLQAVPSAVERGAGPALAANVAGLAGGQMAVAAVAAGVWIVFGEAVRRWDGRVMGLVDLSMLRRAGSFFEHD